jgi:NhaP-type Na+/H+ or K+/H+ antiporter
MRGYGPGPMEPVETAAMAGVVLLVVPVLALRWFHTDELRRPGRQLMIGVVPGVVGAAIALLPRLDLVRDSLDAVVVSLLVVVVAVLVIALVVLRSGTPSEHSDP